MAVGAALAMRCSPGKSFANPSIPLREQSRKNPPESFAMFAIMNGKCPPS
jgi:hypothetical protein